MSINKSVDWGEGVNLSHHKVIRIQWSFQKNGTAICSVIIGSWANRAQSESSEGTTKFQKSYPLEISLADVSSSTEIEQLLVSTLDTPFYGGVVEADVIDTSSIEYLRSQKILEINRSRLAANRSHFEYLGKQIATDEMSMIDIIGVSNSVSLTGQLPVGFPGAWKAKDNTYVPIANVEEWRNFHSAMVATGTANFVKSEGLKAAVALADTPEAIAQIKW